MKKFLGLSLVVVLMLGLVGVAFAVPSPHGLWSDTATVQTFGNAGSVDIETSVRYIHFADRIQPGEQLVVRWWVYNRGYCPVDVFVELFNVPWFLNARFFPSLHFKMRPGTGKQVALAVRMPLGIGDHPQGQNYQIDVKFTAIQDSNRNQTP